MTAFAILSGCAPVKLRTAEDDAKVHEVLVIPLLGPDIAVRRIGLTVFNNKEVAIDPDGELNGVAAASFVDLLRKARPAWNVTYLPEVTRHLLTTRPDGYAITSGDLPGTQQIAAMAAANNADLVFVIKEYYPSNTPALGVGVRLRAITEAGATEAQIDAICSVTLLDGHGAKIQTSWASGDDTGYSSRVAADSLGIDYNLSNMMEKPYQEKIRSAIAERIAVSLQRNAGAFGY